ncbi:hypothetical protein NDA11_005309 [Ustilago hordei]|nr:hypothetical protein NDA11_005309 [Ustilago hordei]KAJ1587675.1 hypothetical protein NDA15_007505 [Ustilago hordei]KAJ1590305.1 hypothetical protein NDA12_005993 [Ustilago hordei]
MDAWIHLLCDCFGMSITEAHSALTTLCYDVTSDYHMYHERKIHLACIASIHASEQIAQYIFAGLPFEMRNVLASSLEGKEAGDLNIFCCHCLAQRATLLTRCSEQQQMPAPVSKHHVQMLWPPPNISLRPTFPPRALADRSVQHPPPWPCCHCGGSHWDANCTKTDRPFPRQALVVAAHHADAMEQTQEDYADLEYRYLELDRSSHSTDLSEVNDIPGMMYSLDASADDSFGSA